MTEKIRSFKEEIDNIHVPIDKLDAIISKTVQGNVLKRRKFNRKKILTSVSAVAVAFVLVVSSSTFSPVMANIVSKIPIIGTVFSESGDLGLEKVSEQGLSNVIGTAEQVEGTIITLDEVFYDETRLTLGFSMQSENPIGEFLSSGPHITIDGKSFSNSSTYRETEQSPTHRTGILNIDAINELPEAFTLGVSFSDEEGKEWNFSTSVNKKSKVQYVGVNHTQKIQGINLTVSDLKVSPAGLQFSFSANSKEVNSLAKGYLDFIVIDNKGKELQSYSGGSESQILDGKDHLMGTRLFDPISDDIKELTVIPYITYQIRGSSAKVDALGNEKISVIKPYEGNDFEFESFTVTLPSANQLEE